MTGASPGMLASLHRYSMAHVIAFASPTGLRSGTILKIKFRNVVGELVVFLNREFQVFAGVRFCIEGRRVVFTTGHIQVAQRV